MDQFTKIRLIRLLETWKSKHGHDISAKDFDTQGFGQDVVKKALALGIIEKYQATNAAGAKENRYKLLKDWRTLG